MAKIMDINGIMIARMLTDCGLPCDHVKTVIAPRHTIFHFSLKNLSYVTENKIKNAVYRLSLLTGYNYSISNSKIAHISLSVVNNKNCTVHLSSMKKPDFNSNSLILGIDENNNQRNLSLDKMVHCLIAGTTGSGKTVFLKSILYTLCISNDYNRGLKFAIVDKKQALNFIEKSRHCLGVANDDKSALRFIEYFRDEMYNRYKKMKKLKIEKNTGEFPKMVLIIDELADLMLSDQAKEIENSLVSLCQLGRAAGIHCILCTQAPRVKIISGLIQANTPTRIIFKTASAKESVLCLGHKGAENLLGSGDCLVKLPDSIDEMRIQAPFASDEQFRKSFI
jgi:S-DNA-T family DNA segregation ATPase FtsK/SpoIIIE